MLKFHDVEQNTDEWFEMRVGKIGGSSIGKIMANYGKAFGNPAKDLASKLALEQLTGISQSENYSNAHMQRGHEQEPLARALYEFETFNPVSNGGFYENGIVGVSPDGLVDEDGLIEIKSVISTVHYSTVARGGYDPSYKWQLYFNLKTSERDWIDFVSFCSTFPEGKKLYTFRVNADESKEEFNMIDQRLSEFVEMVEKRKGVIENSRYL